MFVGQGNTLPLSIRSKSVQLSKKQGIHCLCVDISESEIGKHYLAYGDGPLASILVLTLLESSHGVPLL